MKIRPNELMSLIAVAIALIAILLTSCARPGYRKTDSGWIRKEQAKRIREAKRHDVNYAGNRAFPVTNLDLRKRPCTHTTTK